ncbi:MAG: TolC family protein [Pedosphaera sp.]|nr:TolC family protein [Pedosphaera sp.]
MPRFQGTPFQSAYLVCARLVVIALLAGPGCSTDRIRKSADKEVGQILTQKAPRVPNMDRSFSIDTNLPVDLSELPRAGAAPDFLGPEGTSEQGSPTVSLLKALEIAVRQSREYQLQKEQLYLEALDLSLSRHRFTPIFFGGGSGAFRGSTSREVIGIDPVTQEPITVARNDATLVEGHARFGVSWLLATGARLSASFTTDFLRYVSGDPRALTSSQVAGTLSQPLLRGAGFQVTMENLTQAERNLLYGMRDFVQFKKDFTVRLAGDYYAVLQARDQVRNGFLDLQRSRENARREKAFADEGQRTLASLDQLTQAELNAEARWLTALRDYRESLDRFKITLGLPVSRSLVLAEQDLEGLTIQDPGISVDDAVKIAESVRLDLQNTRQRLEDAMRRVPIAKNALLPQIDASARGNFSENARRGFPLPDPNIYSYSLGLDVDLGLDRKAERNGFRRALIEEARAKRTYALAVDQIKLAVATDTRSLDQARRIFEIAEVGVKLGARRVEEQQLRQQLGRGATRDLLDAQSDLVNAQNARTGALVTHTIARLRYWRDMGILNIGESGMWDEVFRPTSASPPPPTPAATNPNLPSTPP